MLLYRINRRSDLVSSITAASLLMEKIEQQQKSDSQVWLALNPNLLMVPCSFQLNWKLLPITPCSRTYHASCVFEAACSLSVNTVLKDIFKFGPSAYSVLRKPLSSFDIWISFSYCRLERCTKDLLTLSNCAAILFPSSRASSMAFNIQAASYELHVFCMMRG